LTNGKYNDIMPEERDLEEYLAKVRKRWESSLLSEEQNKKIRDKWDDTWMLPEERDNAQEQRVPPREN
jgi:hypothetical protein